MIHSVILSLILGTLGAAASLDESTEARIAAATTTFNANPEPSLHVRVLRGTASLAEGSDVEDVFPSTTSVTQVEVTIMPPSGLEIDVTATSGPTWSQDPSSGAWVAIFPMPAVGGTTLGEYDIVVDPDGVDLTCTGKFKVKKTGSPSGGS